MIEILICILKYVITLDQRWQCPQRGCDCCDEWLAQNRPTVADRLKSLISSLRHNRELTINPGETVVSSGVNSGEKSTQVSPKTPDGRHLRSISNKLYLQS